MHSNAMHLLKKQHSSSVFEYAPIARCLGDTSMDETTRKAIEKKFDIAYMILRVHAVSNYNLKLSLLACPGEIWC